MALGKTTLLNCISTIDNVSSGHIYLGKQDITEIKEQDIAKFRVKMRNPVREDIWQYFLSNVDEE